ncbi:hypothetical protein Bca101_026343 [Brassica carinata]
MGKKAGEPHVITVNCPNRTGLGCDICIVVLNFGFYIKKGDVTTDGMVTSQDPACICAVCPSCPTYFVLSLMSPSPISTPVYLLNFFCIDRTGLLHDVTQVLTELEFSIQSVKVTTTPDGRVLDLFFITENLDILHTNKCQDETLEQFRCVLGESCLSCELNLAGPDSQMKAIPHRDLLYDVLRTLKDVDVKISYGRFLPQTQGHRDIELFVQVNDEKKILDPDKQNSLCSRLKAEMLHPLRVILTNRGLDIELVVANPVELSGKGRPRVFYDVTLSLKVLGICVFSHCLFQLGSASARNEMAYKVIRTFKG